MTPVDSELIRAVGRLEGKIDSLLAAEQRREEAAKELETRITRLERWRSFLAGGFAALAGLFTMFVEFRS